MITHKDAAEAQVRAQQATDEALLAQARAVRAQAERAAGSPFKSAFAEAKRREAQAAVTSAVAMARWAAWGFPQPPLAAMREAAK